MSCIWIKPIVFFGFLTLCTQRDVIFFVFITDKAEAASVSLLIVIGFFLLFFLQNQNFKNNKDSIIEYGNIINNSDQELKEYLVGIGNILEQQNNCLVKCNVTTHHHWY